MKQQTASFRLRFFYGKNLFVLDRLLELFVKSELIESEIAKELYNKCGTIRRMLIASINTAKDNKAIK